MNADKEDFIKVVKEQQIINKDCLYYYDVEGFDENDKYINILLQKITLSKKLLIKLVIELDMIDSERINCVIKDIKLNEDLIKKELGYSQTDIRKLLEEYNQ